MNCFRANLQKEVYTNHWTVAAWLIAIGGAFLIITILLAVWTIIPRLKSSQQKGFIFWGSIAAHGSKDLLQTSFHSQSARTLNDHLLHHIYDIATGVRVPKYCSISLSIAALVLGGFIGAAGLILQDVPSKPSPVTGQPSAASQLPAPPCKNGASTCEPWERDWSAFNLKQGAVVTKDGRVVDPLGLLQSNPALTDCLKAVNASDPLGIRATNAEEDQKRKDCIAKYGK